MSRNNKTQKRRKRSEETPWLRYKGVNVWKTKFGTTAVAAVFDIYSQRFDIPLREARRLDFNHCVDALRKLEDPSYIPWKQRNN